MNGVTCANRATNVLMIDISEMATRIRRTGIFTANRDPKQPVEPIGHGGADRAAPA